MSKNRFFMLNFILVYCIPEPLDKNQRKVSRTTTIIFIIIIIRRVIQASVKHVLRGARGGAAC